MDLLEWLPAWVRLLLVGLAAGWLAASLLREKSLGFWGCLIVGIAGSFLGYLIFRLIGLPRYGLVFSLITALAGALLVILIRRLIKRRGF